MSEREIKLPAHKPGADYEVGYGKPPVATRFRPGRSGNPKGRPRGAKNKRAKLNEERLKGIILDEAYRDITVRDGDRTVSVPMAQAIVRALAVNAAKGQHRAQRLFAEMLSTTERQNKELADAWLETAITYKVEWERELRRREQLGITHLPEPMPHPDQVRIDMNTGEARVQGPATREDRQQVELWETRRDMWRDEITGLLADLESEEDPGEREVLEEDLRQARETLGIIEQLLEKIGY
ncbi:MAG: DUF5681 domain-containing protein [Roseovarius sp.]|nr:DUF5681 domain-containing protein [Roseovarius sp.]